MLPDPLKQARLRLTVQFAALLSILLIAGLAGVYAFASHTLLRAATAPQQLATTSMLETVHLRNSAPQVNAVEFDEEFRELSASLAVVETTLWSANGERLAHAATHTQTACDRVGPPLETLGAGASLVMIQRVVVGDAVLVVVRSLADLGATKQALARALVWIGPLVMLAAIVAGWFLAGRALRPAERSFASQRAFMADAAHELRTPLSVVRAHAELGLDRMSSQDAAQVTFRVILNAADDMAKLSENMLAIARLDGDPHALTRARLPLAELVGDVVFALQPVAHKHNMHIAFVEPPHEIYFEGDGVQLKRLVALLIDNAIQHARVGTIRVSLAHEHTRILLTVDDEGPGMPASLMVVAFDRFVRGSSRQSKERAGHGLGLAMAQSIAHAHGGQIALSRAPEGGLSVRVRLPGRGSATFSMS